MIYFFVGYVALLVGFLLGVVLDQFAPIAAKSLGTGVMSGLITGLFVFLFQLTVYALRRHAGEK